MPGVLTPEWEPESGSSCADRLGSILNGLRGFPIATHSSRSAASGRPHLVHGHPEKTPTALETFVWEYSDPFNTVPNIAPRQRIQHLRNGESETGADGGTAEGATAEGATAEAQAEADATPISVCVAIDPSASEQAEFRSEPKELNNGSADQPSGTSLHNHSFLVTSVGYGLF